jgi:tetratricopeptide (TPR) repeat protein
MNRAEQRVDATQDLRTKALTLQVITLYSLGVGKYATVRKAIHKFYTLMEHETAPRLWEENTALLGIAAGIAGDTPEALRRLRTAADLAHYRGDAVVVWWSLFAQAELLLRLGRIEDAWVRLEQARQHSAERAMPADQFRLHAGEALVYLHRADFAMASQALEHALDWMDQVRMRVPYSMLGYIVAAEVGLALAERAAHDDLARRSYRHLEHFARIYPAARPVLWQLRGRRAQKETQAIACFRRSLAAATALGMPYEEGQAHALLAAALTRQGRADQAAEHAAAARILFARLGAPAHPAIVDAAV